MNYQAHLSRDKQLKPLVQLHSKLSLQPQKDVCTYLCFSIMSQQLSTKVATVIKQRFLDLFEGKTPQPQEILSVQPETLRSIGLSNAKVQYVRNVAEFALSSGLDFKQLQKMTDEEVIDYLTSIKGVGRWTAEMLLMFALAREDVFSPGDLGIQLAIADLFKLDMKDKGLKPKMITLAEKWSPYRTYACLLLWRSRDGKK